MSDPFVGEIKMFAGNFPPNGWAFCQGQLLPISENDVLFNLIGTTYGGDGQETFALPNLSGRLPVHQGQGSGLTNRVIGELGGVEEVTLTVQQIPAHSHSQLASTALGTEGNAAGNVPAQSNSLTLYRVPDNTPVALNAGTLLPAGGSQPHTNLQPYLCVNFIISLFGIYPTQS